MASLPKQQARSRSATGLRRFSGIAHLAGLVNFIAAKAKIGGCHHVFTCNMSPLLWHLAPVLRGVVLLGQTHFGASADGKCVGFTSATQSQSL